jgi:hypothetical protein
LITQSSSPPLHRLDGDLLAAGTREHDYGQPGVVPPQVLQHGQTVRPVQMEVDDRGVIRPLAQGALQIGPIARVNHLAGRELPPHLALDQGPVVRVVVDEKQAQISAHGLVSRHAPGRAALVFR